MSTPNGGTDPRFPNRPEHPDFWELSKIIVSNDETAESGPDGLDKVLSSIPVDLSSLAYMAQQRALRAQKEVRGENIGTLLALLWMDSFIAGYQMATNRVKDVTVKIDPSVEGSHRRAGT